MHGSAGESLDTSDQRVFLSLDWRGFETFLKLRGDTNANRITYLDGTLEIMSPSTSHEVIKTRIARLLEAWADEMDVELDGYGSWTVKNKKQKASLEPDECYLVGHRAPGSRPDLAIEVVWTHGGLEKLEVYHRLGVPEVWVWQDALTVYRRNARGYSPARKSALLPTLDLALLARFVAEPNQTQAVKAFRAAIRKH